MAPKERASIGINALVILALALIVAAFVVAAPAIAAERAWSFTPAQAKALEASTAKAPYKLQFTIYVVPGAPHSAYVFGYRLIHAFAIAGWPVQIEPFDAYNSPEDIGLHIATVPNTVPDTEKVLAAVLAHAGLKAVRSDDERLRGSEVAVVVGAHP